MEKITKQSPTPVVGMKPYGKSQLICSFPIYIWGDDHIRSYYAVAMPLFTGSGMMKVDVCFITISGQTWK